MESVWKSVKLPAFGPLEGDAHTDVLIVGGGMAGVLCARLLKEAGVDNLLIEAKTLADGVTGSTTAKITAHQGLNYQKLIHKLGHQQAKLYLQSQQAALEEYRRRCREIDCDFQEADDFVYSLDDRRKIDREVEALAELGAPGEFVSDLSLPFPVAGAVKLPGQAQFHPLKFLAPMADGLNIREQTKLLELRPGAAITDRGAIRAEKIIIATHFPILNKHGGYFLKMYQSRSYVLALDGGPDVGGMYIDESGKGLSFRNWNGKLLLGGGGHRTGKQGGGWAELERLAGEYYPGAPVTARWAAQDCMTLDALPYIGRYSPRTPDLYVATGFGKWGMTGAMSAAMVLRDMLLDRPNPGRELFDPARHMYLPQPALNGLAAAGSLLTPTRPRCPHMGCALKWNKQEHTWDCPCHGSRFQENGKLLDGPATDDKKRSYNAR